MNGKVAIDIKIAIIVPPIPIIKPSKKDMIGAIISLYAKKNKIPPKSNEKIMPGIPIDFSQLSQKNSVTIPS